MSKKMGRQSQGAPPPENPSKPELSSRAEDPGIAYSQSPSRPPAPGEFPVVGIGASAGGLAAFEAFFAAMPPDSEPGMAFVLVQHLAPDPKNLLSELVRRYTTMQVFDVEDGMVVQPNCAYIIPPGRDMAFLNGTLQLLEPREPRGQRMPIDFFFRSLALSQRTRSIGIVLSGTGNDGTEGIRAIKAEGGLVMVQNSASTEFDGMPCSAIATGLVDFELPPGEMPAQLLAYGLHANEEVGMVSGILAPNLEQTLSKVFVLLGSCTGHDFSQYKPSTIHRRIERRMAVQQVDSIENYVKYLHQTPNEVDALFRDLLIGVTSFFRNPEVFRVLEEQVVASLFEDRLPQSTIRIWVPGCSTGEEAYSLTMLIVERMEALKQNYTVHVFATDIDTEAIAIARAGVYPASIATDVSDERLARFFTANDDGSAYRIRKNVRDLLVFSEQSVIKDPPFSRIDLISCRNLLIYMGAELQKKLVPLFHYSLNPGGWLLLGTSEGVGEFDRLFSPWDRKMKLFRRQEDSPATKHTEGARFLPPMTEPSPASTMAMAQPETHKGEGLSLRETTEQALLSQVIAAALLVNSFGEILYLQGRTGMFLELAHGEPETPNILKMAREGLRHELAATLRKAVSTGAVSTCLGLRVKTNSHFTLVNLTVRPIPNGTGASVESPLYVVILEEVPTLVSPGSSSISDPTQGPLDVDSSDASSRVAWLEGQLRAKEESLQSAHEELESSIEELRSSNEEMQSVNEELQSANEELETSKEELQSVNEELATVNTELQSKVRDLSRTNNDMNNLLAGTGIGTVFVDHDLRILRFTPAARSIINLIDSDVGRPVAHLVSNLVTYGSLVEDVQMVLDTLAPKELRVETTDHKHFMMRIQPYRTLENTIEGAVISFVDITDRKTEDDEASDLIRESHKRFRALATLAPIGIYLTDATGKCKYVNPHWCKMAGLTQDEAIGGPWDRAVHPDDRAAVSAKWNGMTASGDDFESEYRFQSRGGHVTRAVGRASPRRDASGEVIGYVGVSLDTRDHRKAEEADELSRLAAALHDAQDAIVVEHLDGHILAWSAGATRLYGWDPSEAMELSAFARVPESIRNQESETMRRLSGAETLEPYRTQRLTKSGEVLTVSVVATALVNEAGQTYAVATTERRSSTA